MVSALFKASEAGDVDQVREVLKECSSIDIETKDHTGTTPLIAAVKNSHIEVVKELLAAGADPLNPSSQGPPSSHTSDPELLSLLSLAVRPPPLHQQQQQQYPSFNPHHQPPPPQFQEMGYPPMEMQQGGGYPGFYPPAGMYIPQYGMPYPPPNGQFPQGMAPPQHHQQQQIHMHMQQPQHEMQQQQQMPPQQQQILPGEEKVGGENGVVGENGAGTIPPPDVSKMIPCKFFPDCRYGAQCAFLHPPQPAFTPPPAPPPSAMYPQHYQHGPEHFPHPFYQMPPPFGYNGQMRPPPPHVMSPPPQQQQQAPYPFQRHQHQPPHHLSMPDYNNENAFIVVPPPFQPPPNFSPSALATPFAPSPPVGGLPTPQQQSSSSSSSPPPPPSAPVQEVSPPSDPAIVAVPPPATESSAPAVVEPVVQQQQQREFTPQQQQYANNGFVRRTGPFGPGAGGFAKKNWLAGGAKKWLGGAVPPCIYFARALCRNGDTCRFPHIRNDGTDCRLPGVIDGSVPAAPVSNMNKAIANRNFPNNVDATPSTQQTLDSSVELLPASDAGSVAPQDSPVEDKLANLSVASLDATSSSSSSTTPTGPRSFSSHIPSAATPAFVPAPRSAGPPSHQPPFHNNVNRPMFPHQQPRSAPSTRPVSPNAISASQHFSQVASANQRSSSAAPLRRKEDGAPLGAPQQQQQMSQSSHVVKQRVPSSEDFPALGGGSVGSLRESVGTLAGSVVVVGKTAAQVLSGPAPEKAKFALGGKKMAAQQKKKVEEDARSTESSSSSAEPPHHSDLSSEDDTVLVAAAKSAPSAPNGAPSPSLVKKPLSFANAAGALVGAKA